MSTKERDWIEHKKKVLEIKAEKNWFKRQWLTIKKNYSNSEIFWSSILYVLTIVFLFIDFQIVLSLSMIASVGLLLRRIFDNPEFEKTPLWIPLVLFFYIALLFALIAFICVYVWENTIENFNKWLNNK